MFRLLTILTLLVFQLHGNDDRPPVPYNYLAKTNVQQFIEMMHRNYGFERRYLKTVLQHAKLDRDTLARYTGTFKKNSTVGSWERFKLHVVNEGTYALAKEFKKKHLKTLRKAARIYQVDEDYIVGFLGVESRFGTYTGDYNVLDALSTLAFHKNRMQPFFKKQLKHLFLFAREKHYDITKIEGSFAGAMGCVQQVPSIARTFNYDFDGDGASVWDIEDCIGSIAKFMHRHGWKREDTVAVEAHYRGKRFNTLRTGFKTSYTLAALKRHHITPSHPYPYKRASLIKLHNRTHDELWLGAKNFHILTRYNASSNYGMAIHKIADSLKQSD